jgi:hypothetical protein
VHPVKCLEEKIRPACERFECLETKAKNYMLFGHNSNVKVGEATFHVQTEDRGVTTALIDTTVYYMGRVMHRRTNNYHDLVPLDPDREEALRLRLDEQHRSTLEDIRSGALYLAAPPPAKAARVPGAPGTETPHRESSAEKASSAPSVVTTNGAGTSPPVASHSPGGQTGANVLASLVPSVLKLQLRNAQAWLTGKQARLEISVATQTGEPLAGARVIAYVEGAAAPIQYSAETDSGGYTQISFEMPRLSSEPAALVIEAERDHGEPISGAKAQGKLRFALRTKPRPA